MSVRILFVGENWHGSNATSMKRAFRMLGCDVHNIDDWHIYPQWESFGLKVLRRVLRPFLVAEMGRRLLRLAAAIKPHFVFVFKGVLVAPDALKRLHEFGTILYNFYPDWDFGAAYRAFGNNFLNCVPLYDCIFTPKSYHVNDFYEVGAQRVEFLPYAYDPTCHFPVKPSPEERARFGADVVFVGIWGRERADMLEALVRNSPPYRLSVWGARWDCVSLHSPLRPYLKLRTVTGQEMGKVYASSKIALSFLTPPDLHTARTFEIPAFGAFMLAQRTQEQLRFFQEGVEAAYFDDVEELREKIEYYLAHEDEREAIAKAGYEKVTKEGHSYVDRMRRVLEVYQEMAG